MPSPAAGTPSGYVPYAMQVNPPLPPMSSATRRAAAASGAARAAGGSSAAAAAAGGSGVAPTPSAADVFDASASGGLASPASMVVGDTMGYHGLQDRVTAYLKRYVDFFADLTLQGEWLVMGAGRVQRLTELEQPHWRSTASAVRFTLPLRVLLCRRCFLPCRGPLPALPIIPPRCRHRRRRTQVAVHPAPLEPGTGNSAAGHGG